MTLKNKLGQMFKKKNKTICVMSNIATKKQKYSLVIYSHLFFLTLYIYICLKHVFNTYLT